MAKSTIIQDIMFGETFSTSKVFIGYRIISSTLAPDEISHELMLKPTKAWRKGEVYIGKTRCKTTHKLIRVERTRTNGLWSLSSENRVTSSILEDHAQYLLGILEPKAEVLMKYLNDRDHYSVTWYIWWECNGEHGGFQLSSDILKRLSKICHYLDSSLLFMLDDGIEDAYHTS